MQWFLFCIERGKHIVYGAILCSYNTHQLKIILRYDTHVIRFVRHLMQTFINKPVGSFSHFNICPGICSCYSPPLSCLKRLFFFTLFQSVNLTKTVCGKGRMAANCAALSFVVVCHLSKSITLCLLRLLCSLHDASMSSRSWMEGKNSLSQQDAVAEARTANFSVVEKTLHHWAIFPFCHLHFILRFDTSFKETA